LRRLVVAPSGGGGPALGRQRLEPVDVDVLVINLEQVAGCTGDDGLAVADVEHSAQVRHICLYESRRGRRWGIAPHRVDQTRYRHDPVGVQQPGREKGCRLAGGQFELPAIEPHFGRAQQAELHPIPPHSYQDIRIGSSVA
jgi:hypothetical protein